MNCKVVIEVDSEKNHNLFLVDQDKIKVKENVIIIIKVLIYYLSKRVDIYNDAEDVAHDYYHIYNAYYKVRIKKKNKSIN